MSNKRNLITILRIDPTICAGIGMCSRIATKTIVLDPWGFPLIPADALSDSQVKEAHKAVRACPKKALFIESREFGE